MSGFSHVPEGIESFEGPNPLDSAADDGWAEIAAVYMSMEDMLSKTYEAC